MGKIGNFVNRKVNGVYKWYGSLSSIKKLFVCIVGVLILALLVGLLSRSSGRTQVIDYNNVTLESILGSSKEEPDRLIFLKSEGIIKEMFDICNGDYRIENKKPSLDDYYKFVLLQDYKNEITKGKFKSCVKEIVDDFEKEYSTRKIEELENTSVIEKVYRYTERNGWYLVKLNIKDKAHYVGIDFSLVDNSYSLFYIS